MKILMIDHFPEEMRKKLQLPGLELHYQPDFTREEILPAMADVEVLVMNSKTQVDRELLDVAPELRLICRAGVGMDHFDLPLLAERGIKVVNTPGANAIPVGEQAVGMLLALLHNIVRADKQVREFVWEREGNRGTELRGKTVGIIGYGHTGSQVGAMLQGFGCRVLAYDKYKTGYAPKGVEECDLDTLYKECQILSLHIPLTEETKGWINAEFLSRFAHPIVLLNLARGPIVPLEDLIQALKSGEVIAAALDVLENEKLNSLSSAEQKRLQWLFDQDRVIFTPHIGGWSHESLQRINDWLVGAIRD
jgi:D-3-phosphoglycerate dehydrogenase